MFRILFLICFLIIYSCDLPNEANKDCNGDEAGLAQLDDCGICSGGNTSNLFNANLDQCGNCFGDDICCSELCTDSLAINFCDDATEDINCIYNICEDYYDINNDFNCSLNGSSPYQIGDYLSCETVQKEFGLCYPEDCDKTVKLADFEGKNILIIYEFDWWGNCFNDISQLEEDIILEYIDHPDIAVINVINDAPGGKSCEIWGTGDEDYDNDDRVPIIINETNFGEPGDFNNWFYNSGDWTAQYSSPWYIIIDSNFKYIDLLATKNEALMKLEELLD